MTDDDREIERLAARAAELRRQQGIADFPAPDDSSWIFAVSPQLAEMHAAHVEHETSCTARPCEDCEKFVCRCGAHVDGVRECESCARKTVLDEQMQRTIESIPPDFRWALGASAAELRANSARTKQPYVSYPEDEIARGLALPPSKHLHFRGSTGTGKTTLAIAMLYAWVRAEPHRRRGSFFVDACDLARARQEYKLGRGEAPLIERACRVPLLLIDELGGEAHDRDGGIRDVVYRRANASKPTWVTCGQVAYADADQFAAYLKDRYDGGFSRRIAEFGKAVMLNRRPEPTRPDNDRARRSDVQASLPIAAAPGASNGPRSMLMGVRKTRWLRESLTAQVLH